MIPINFLVSSFRCVLADLDAAHVFDDAERAQAAHEQAEALIVELEKWGEAEVRGAANDG